MSQSQLKDQNHNSKLQLPSILQFYTNSLINYTQLTIKKIEMHLIGNHTLREPVKCSQNPKYHKVSNQELKRRSSFLLIVYQLIMVYNQFISEISSKTYKELSNLNECIVLSVWLQKLKLGSQQLSKLTRLKNNMHQDSKVEYFNKRLFGLLFEAQIYNFQILIRLVILKMIYSQYDKYNYELNQLKNKFRFHHIDPWLEDNQEMIQCNRPMRKSSQMKSKQLFRQINKIITFYLLEVSTNRPDCRIKPELQYLLQLIEAKFSNDFVAEVFRKTELGSLNLQIKQNKKSNIFSPFILVPLSSENIIEPQSSKENEQFKDKSKNQKSQKEDIDLKDFQSEQFISINDKEQSVEIVILKNQMNQTHNYRQEKQHRQEPAKPIIHNLFEKTAETAKFMHLQSPRSQKFKSKLQGQLSHLSNLKHKNKSFKHYQRAKLSKYNHYKKLQYISKNQRFSSRCNLQHKLVKPKRRNSQSQYPSSEEIKQYNKQVCKQTKVNQSPKTHINNYLPLAAQFLDERRHEKKQND